MFGKSLSAGMFAATGGRTVYVPPTLDTLTDDDETTVLHDDNGTTELEGD